MLALVALALFAAPSARFGGASPEAIAARVAAIEERPGARERVLSASEAFLGTPYQLDPLGEGRGHPPAGRRRGR